MLQDAGWASYLAARRAALHSCADHPDVATAAIGRAEARLRAYLGIGSDEARVQARRCFLYASDAAFHDQLLASGRIDLLHALVAKIEADHRSPLCDQRGGAVAVSLHYGPATSILPLWLAMAAQRGLIPELGVIENSRRNPSVMVSASRLAELGACGFPIADLDIARLGELSVLRRALAILRGGGTVLIFADGQLPEPGAKRTFECQLGRRPLVLPHGPNWLAHAAGVPLVPLLLKPQADNHRIVALPASPPSRAQSAVQALIDEAMALDPAPWSRWCCSADHL
jgi:hypothetical protein